MSTWLSRITKYIHDIEGCASDQYTSSYKYIQLVNNLDNGVTVFDIVKSSCKMFLALCPVYKRTLYDLNT